MSIIFLSGPPGSGKDYASEYIEDAWDFWLMSFKTPLFEIVKAIGVDWSWWEDIYMNRSKRGKNKDTPLKELGGLSQRQLLIRTSEDFIKPILGLDAFGKIALQGMKDVVKKFGPHNFVFSDSGFVDEVKPIMRWAGEKNCYLIKLEREGCSFEGDSRSYLPEEMFSHKNVATIVNDGTSNFDATLDHVMSRWFLE